ncbi:hypothetical protein ACOACO_17620 [Nocardioides sp. CPCC 205120]|uniref:hypothetical protein n=1 Tax=Nocardioides sp. CPCC 205120 TaxID=3406462 RepID=UPI003B514588
MTQADKEFLVWLLLCGVVVSAAALVIHDVVMSVLETRLKRYRDERDGSRP